MFRGMMSSSLSQDYDATCTHVKEVTNTRLLVSVNYQWDQSAHLEVFDVSRKGQVKKLYSFEEISGSKIN